MLLSDTVGFISDLPVQVIQIYLFLFQLSKKLKSRSRFFIVLYIFIIQLVEAFHATLEEVVEADLLVVGTVFHHLFMFQS